ncbi:MAG: phosphatidylserine decarboxylase family protein [Bacteroidota bacterium]
MRIHREGYRTLVGVLLMLLAIHFMLLRYSAWPTYVYAPFAVATALFYAFLVYFFRDPPRTITAEAHQVVAPADGQVVVVQEVAEDEYFQSKRIQISIYMSPFNVHINRSPVEGTVKFCKYHPGKYLVAWHPKSSTKNERTTVVVENKAGISVLVRQIAGFVARRIKCYPQVGDQLQQGEEFGFIKFGSRADVFLPLDADIKVSLGDKVQGGASVLAAL